jgi:hypothetical protein
MWNDIDGASPNFFKLLANIMGNKTKMNAYPFNSKISTLPLDFQPMGIKGSSGKKV